MVENEYCRSCSQEYDLVAAGSIADPDKAMVLEEPTVSLTDGDKSVEYKVPTFIRGVGDLQRFAGHSAIGLRRSEPLDYSVEPVVDGIIAPALPRLARLAGRRQHAVRYIDALYLGEPAIKRINTAELISDKLENPPRRDATSAARQRRRRRF
jgi:hypothetical protein